MLETLAYFSGREERIRTSDPSVPNAVLYQAEPLPDFAVLLTIARYQTDDLVLINAGFPLA